jgi:hypothetical protein
LLKWLLIGDNAFIGVSHLSHAKARQKLEQLRLENIVEVIKNAVSCGATGFAFTVHPTNLKILKALDDTEIVDGGLEILPVLPYAAGYVRAVNEKGMSGLLTEVLTQLPLRERAKLLVQGGISAVTLDPFGMLDAYVDMELSGLRVFKWAKLKTVLLHEVVTDIGLSFRSKDLFNSYVRHIRDKYHAMPGFVTRNFVSFVRFFLDSGLSMSGTVIMTPMNSIGFQMNPSKESCERCLAQMSNGNVVAMSILAGGYLRLEEAIEYLRGLQNLSGVVVGVSSKTHSEETFTRLRRLAIAS